MIACNKDSLIFPSELYLICSYSYASSTDLLLIHVPLVHLDNKQPSPLRADQS